MGNICRSPAAEGVVQAVVKKAGWQDRVEIDSAGTGAGTPVPCRMPACGNTLPSAAAS
jgi:protein-tyrosine-phosphatase